MINGRRRRRHACHFGGRQQPRPSSVDWDPKLGICVSPLHVVADSITPVLYLADRSSYNVMLLLNS